jgi:hypothetical protein
MKDKSKISLFDNYRGTIPAGEISVYEFCLNVIDCDYKNEIDKLRKIEDKKGRDAIKKTLPAATISGTFTERKKEGLKIHSGFIAIDLDAGDNPNTNWPELRDNLAKIRNVYFSALSASGKGVFALIPITDPEMHEQHFDSLKRDLWSVYGLKMDPKCRDVSRLRGISSDPDAKLNPEAIPYGRTYTAPRQEPLPARYDFINGDFDRLIKKINDSGIDITADYGDWLRIGWALVNEKGVGGRSLYHQISKYYSGYNRQECDRQYSACLRNPGQPTKNFLFALCKDFGILVAGDKREASASAPRPGNHNGGRRLQSDRSVNN